jgi:hypothetical protein
MVSSGLVGVGMLGVLNLTFVSQSGAVSSRSISTAKELAAQRLESLSTMAADRLPACAGAVGCRASATTARTPLAPVAGFQCTQQVPGMELVDPSAAAVGTFRVDTVVAVHPGAQQQVGARLVTVSVCWTDEDGRVQELRAQKMMVPES